MTTGDLVYSLRFSLIKILPEPGFDLGSTAGESCVLTARLHMLYISQGRTQDFDGGAKNFFSDLEICMLPALWIVRGHAPREFILNGAIWCVLV